MRFSFSLTNYMMSEKKWQQTKQLTLYEKHIKHISIFLCYPNNCIMKVKDVIDISDAFQQLS